MMSLIMILSACLDICVLLVLQSTHVSNIITMAFHFIAFNYILLHYVTKKSFVTID